MARDSFSTALKKTLNFSSSRTWAAAARARARARTRTRDSGMAISSMTASFSNWLLTCCGKLCALAKSVHYFFRQCLRQICRHLVGCHDLLSSSVKIPKPNSSHLVGIYSHRNLPSTIVVGVTELLGRGCPLSRLGAGADRRPDAHIGPSLPDWHVRAGRQSWEGIRRRMRAGSRNCVANREGGPAVACHVGQASREGAPSDECAPIPCAG